MKTRPSHRTAAVFLGLALTLAPWAVTHAVDSQATAPVSTLVQLSPYHLVLPTPSGTKAQTAFAQEAAQAVRAVYLGDDNDPKRLQHAQADLAKKPELADLQRSWGPLLDAALARSANLRMLAPALGPMKRALKGTGMQRGAAAPRNVSFEACREAFMAVPMQNSTADSLVVTAPPMGTTTVGRLRAVCRDTRRNRLQARTLEGRPADPQLRRDVRRLWATNGLPGQARQIQMLGAWRNDGRGRAMGTVVGVVDVNAMDGEPCAVVRVEVKRLANGTMRLGSVGERQVVLCERLR